MFLSYLGKLFRSCFICQSWVDAICEIFGHLLDSETFLRWKH